MAAAEREVADLLKESTDSKINVKTTWNSTLIDDFSNIEKFKEKETNSMNFQHASIVLDGCIKVYSTRVDSVLDVAEKLMGSVGRAKQPEKQKPRAKAHPTIESNPEAILIRQKIVSTEDEVLEHLARESKEGDTRGLLIHLLRWSDTTGFRVLQQKTGASSIKQEEDNDLYINFDALRQSLHIGETKKQISPMFSSFTPDKSVDELVLPTYAYNISYDTDALAYAYKENNEAFAEYSPYAESEAVNEFEESAEHADPKAKECIVESRPSKEELHLVYTPFGYSKGWAGPSHWKVQSRRRPKEKEKTEKKERKKSVIDFLADQHLPISMLFEKGENIVLTPQQISERRKNCNTLPPDHNVKIEDLYQMFVYPGALYATEETKVESEAQQEEPFISSNDLPENRHTPEDPLEYPTADEPVDFTNNREAGTGTAEEGVSVQPTLLSRRLLQSALRKACRNDIVKIKENMWNRIEQGEKRIDEMYTSMEDQKVSVQFYLVSLLHLANEKNLRISSSSTEHLPSISDLLLLSSSESNTNTLK